MDLSGFFIEGAIGGGGFGQIFLVQNTVTKKQFALKRQAFKLGDADFDLAQIQLELQIHTQGDPNFFVKAFAAWDHGDSCYMLLERMIGDITILREVNEHQLVSIVHQVCKAITYLYGCGYVHRDLRPQNLLVDNMFNVKLSDFGICVKSSFNPRGVLCGTPGYMAPESVLKTVYSEQSDWFSFGLIIRYFITGGQHYTFKSYEEAAKHWANPDMDVSLDLIEIPEWRDYVAKFVVRTVSDRNSYKSSLKNLDQIHPMLLNFGSNIQTHGHVTLRARQIEPCTRVNVVVKNDHPELYKMKAGVLRASNNGRPCKAARNDGGINWKKWIEYV